MEYSSRGSFQGSQEVPIQSKLTVEHVLPQSWEKDGYYPIKDITDEFRLARNHLIHTFGNLTLLTGSLNSSVSNGPFLDSQCEKSAIEGKKTGLGKSTLVLNTYFNKTTLQAWDDTAIHARAEATLTAALLVWPRPFKQLANPRSISDALAGAC